ncbi:MAG TPA: PaaI family thioesterase [Kofleriaceae bacterium]|nr:PaaI family thioesterase [Kofleriaceae bacterium]
MSGDLHFVQRLGFELDREAPDGPTVCVNVDAMHRNSNGVVHGSVIHALLDSAMGMLCFRAAGRHPVATAEISVRFLRPVFDGRLEARARVLHTGKRLLFAEAEVRREGEVMAVGQATFVPVGR